MIGVEWLDLAPAPMVALLRQSNRSQQALQVSAAETPTERDRPPLLRLPEMVRMPERSRNPAGLRDE
jgi:hypothetical protein